MLIGGFLLLWMSTAFSGKIKHAFRFLSFFYIFVGIPQIIYKIFFPLGRLTEYDVWALNFFGVLEFLWLIVFVLTFFFISLRWLWKFSAPKKEIENVPEKRNDN